MPRIQVGELSFQVRDDGKGFPVVLLHGFPDTSSLWRHQIAALNAAGYRTVAPDMRGRGASDKPHDVAEYALQKIVGDVTAIMDALGIARAHVVGHDWGAAVAWLVAILAPERVDHLAVISVGFPGAAGKPTLAALQKAWYRILVQFEGVAERLFQQDDWYLFRELIDGGGDPVEEHIARLSDPGALVAGLNWYRANLPVERLLDAPQLPPVTVPTMGVFGTEDKYLTEQAMVASASRVKGPWRYERLEGVGHWIPLEAAGRLNDLLIDFFAR
ncbi:MAG TPA: alpha/beta fold hydrolase [Candidatus Udaeobacter sp.]|nr:alpha/beta fold hydrolase [Candidatus Udaeobacter sp.]